tara:strand:+ start:311 stop:739 length:429 start_codon:yes stop_codon:yes gene_type:complete
MSKKLVTHVETTAKQDLFLDHLFGEAGGNVAKAKELAGYSPSYKNVELMKLVREQILDRCTNYLAFHTPKAAIGMINIIDDPVAPGNREKLSAITSLMDRVGLIKAEKVVHDTGENNVIFIVPAKKPVEFDGIYEEVENGHT